VSRLAWVVAALALLGCRGGPTVPRPRANRAPLRIAYSDWPGWTAFDVALKKGWFEEAGVPVAFSFFEYLPSMDAFSAGKVDAVCVTNGDALVTGASGARSKMILVNDYSNGNDQVIARPGIATFEELRGKKIGLELTLVEHLMLTRALEKYGMLPREVQLVNVPTNRTPEALASGEVSAVAAWYPVSAQVHRAVPGATALFTSADVPGLIYDTLAVNPESLAARREDWAKLVKVWYRVADFVRDPLTRPEAVAIMAARTGSRPEEFAEHLSGTYFLSLPEAKRRFHNDRTLESLYGSSRIADGFNVAYKAYKVPEKVEEYVDSSFVDAL
jgi:NitT/TauT family transport system substrate-binding protein